MREDAGNLQVESCESIYVSGVGTCQADAAPRNSRHDIFHAFESVRCPLSASAPRRRQRVQCTILTVSYSRLCGLPGALWQSPIDRLAEPCLDAPSLGPRRSGLTTSSVTDEHNPVYPSDDLQTTPQ